MIGWEKFLALELIGFFMLVGGTLVYNEIVILPCTLFNYNTKAEISKREGKLDDFVDDGKNYVATSPHAAYDSNRMKRNLDAPGNPGDRQNLLRRHDEAGEIYMHNEINT
jgi:hypothetical protein